MKAISPNAPQTKPAVAADSYHTTNSAIQAMRESQISSLGSAELEVFMDLHYRSTRRLQALNEVLVVLRVEEDEDEEIFRRAWGGEI
ncbi:unnamed protein product [Penicillium glandicola]